MLILILLWLLIGFLVYSSIAVPVFMELALNKPKRTGDGRLSVNKNSFVAQYFYGKNIVKTKEERFFPKNTYQLYKGIWAGIILTICFSSFIFGLLIAVFLMLYVVAGPFLIMAGYFPNPFMFFNGNKNKEEPYYPYERIGSKKWIAPWKFILPIGLVTSTCFFYKGIYASLVKIFVGIFVNLVKISVPLHSKTALIIYGSIAGLIFLIIVINRIRKTESFAAMKETVGSFFKKMCKEVEVR